MGIDKGRDRPVMLGAKDAAFFMRAGDEAAVPVACLAVRVIGRLAINRNAFGFGPPHNAIARQVFEQEAIPISHPHETFYPAEARGQLLEWRVIKDVPSKPPIDNFEVVHVSYSNRQGELCARRLSNCS